eukprot:PhF_6_TR35791/c0_g1_i1/m.52020
METSSTAFIGVIIAAVVVATFLFAAIAISITKWRLTNQIQIRFRALPSPSPAPQHPGGGGMGPPVPMVEGPKPQSLPNPNAPSLPPGSMPPMNPNSGGGGGGSMPPMLGRMPPIPSSSPEAPLLQNSVSPSPIRGPPPQAAPNLNPEKEYLQNVDMLRNPNKWSMAIADDLRKTRMAPYANLPILLPPTHPAVRELPFQHRHPAVYKMDAAEPHKVPIIEFKGIRSEPRDMYEAVLSRPLTIHSTDPIPEDAKNETRRTLLRATSLTTERSRVYTKTARSSTDFVVSVLPPLPNIEPEAKVYFQPDAQPLVRDFGPEASLLPDDKVKAKHSTSFFLPQRSDQLDNALAVDLQRRAMWDEDDLPQANENTTFYNSFPFEVDGPGMKRFLVTPEESVLRFEYPKPSGTGTETEGGEKKKKDKKEKHKKDHK